MRYYIHSRSFLQIKCKMNVFSLLFFYPVYRFSSLSLSQHNESIQRFKGNKKQPLNYYIISDTNVSIFDVFFCFFPFIPVTTKKTQTYFRAKNGWYWFLHYLQTNVVFFLVYCRNQQRNYNWHHRLLVSKWMKMVANTKEATNAGYK